MPDLGTRIAMVLSHQGNASGVVAFTAAPGRPSRVIACATRAKIFGEPRQIPIFEIRCRARDFAHRNQEKTSRFPGKSGEFCSWRYRILGVRIRLAETANDHRMDDPSMKHCRSFKNRAARSDPRTHASVDASISRTLFPSRPSAPVSALRCLHRNSCRPHLACAVASDLFQSVNA